MEEVIHFFAIIGAVVAFFLIFGFVFDLYGERDDKLMQQEQMRKSIHG